MTGAIALAAIQRLMHPEPTGGVTVIVVALAGVAVNGVTALMFASGRKGDLNIRGAFLHMASDALVALGVAVSGGVFLLTGWAWLDPAVSLAIAAVIVAGTWGLMRGVARSGARRGARRRRSLRGAGLPAGPARCDRGP